MDGFQKYFFIFGRRVFVKNQRVAATAADKQKLALRRSLSTDTFFFQTVCFCVSESIIRSSANETFGGPESIRSPTEER